MLKLQPQSLKDPCNNSAVKHVFTDVGIRIVKGQLVQYERCQKCGLLLQKNR